MPSLETSGYKAQKYLFLFPFCLLCLPYTEAYRPAELLLHFLQGEKAFFRFLYGNPHCFYNVSGIIKKNENTCLTAAMNQGSVKYLI